MEHSEFFDYLLKTTDSSTESLPALKELSQEIGISISTFREQLEAAKIWVWLTLNLAGVFAPCLMTLHLR